jgi:hypothetical protein
MSRSAISHLPSPFSYLYSYPMSLRVRQTLVRVLTIQVITLVLLWLLQQRYAS